MCLPDEELERLLANQLSDAEEQALEVHLAGCEACQRRLDKLTHFGHHTLPPTDGNHEISPPSDRILSRLANSARPVMRFVGKRPTESNRASESAPVGNTTPIVASGRFLRRHYWTWPLLAAAWLSGVGWWVSRSVESAMREQRVSELTTVLEADVAALRGWIGNQRSTAELVAADESLRPFVRELLATSDGSSEVRGRLVRSQAQALLRSRLAEPLRRGGFTGFVLASPSGITLAADEDAPVGAALLGYRRDFFKRVSDGQALVSKPFSSPLLLDDGQGELRAGLPSMYAAAPILGDDGQPIAALGLRIRPEGEFTRILHVARSGRSGETYAFDRKGLLISQSRFDDQLKRIGLLVDRPENKSILSIELRDPGVNLVEGDRPEIRRENQPLTRMARDAVQGIDGNDVDGYRDYRGVPVVGAWQWLDDYDFGVATEIDVEEAFAPAKVVHSAFAFLMSLLVASAFGILLAMLLVARKQRELLEANMTARRLGQYQLDEKLGTGGMGTVYKARHALLRRPTAIKLLKPELVSDSAIARFEREVQLTSALTHPNTVAIYDYGRTSDGLVYYVMEYLEGMNLDQLVRQYGPLAESRVVYILRQVCASLAEAHEAGLVHRDVKPANIILTVRGGQHDFVKVLDFGLAKVVNEKHAGSITVTDLVAGTPLYVSPEAINHSAAIDSRADVYAIGAVGYFLLTGSPVFAGSSAADICLMHISMAPKPPSARLKLGVSPTLEALLLRCLAKSPADRPANAGELLHLLETSCAADCWTPIDAARWWADRDQERSVVLSAPVQRHATVAVSGNAVARAE